MVPEHKLPLLLRISQHIPEPCDLLGSVLLGNIRKARLAIIIIHQRRSIEEDQSYGHRIVYLSDKRIIMRRHPPTPADIRIVDLRLGTPFIIVIAQHRVPIHLQRRMLVYVLKIAYPQRILNGSDTLYLEIITARNDKARF